MPEKKKYKLTREARKDIRTRAKSEAGLAEAPKKKFKTRSKIGQALTGQRYKIPKTGAGSKRGREVEREKQKPVAGTYRKFKTEKTGETKQVDKKDFKAKTESSYKKKAEGTTEGMKMKKDPNWEGRKTLKANEEKEAKAKYKKNSRTMKQAEQDVELNQKRKKYEARYGKMRGRRKMKRERKKHYKEQYRKTGYMS